MAIYHRYSGEHGGSIGYAAHIGGGSAGLLVGMNILRNFNHQVNRLRDILKDLSSRKMATLGLFHFIQSELLKGDQTSMACKVCRAGSRVAYMSLWHVTKTFAARNA